MTLSDAIADRLGVPPEERRHLAAAAHLHDIGKIAIAPEVLNKPGPLSAEEWRVMRRHTIEGGRILATVPEIAEVARVVRSCHERYDGHGYPDGLAGEEIPLVARIVFCADAFHAMRCDRPYRVGRPADEALAEVTAHAGTQFDPAVATALREVRAVVAGARQRRAGWLPSTVRGRKLVALLATLAVSGSAMAATGAYKSLPLVGSAGGAPAVTPKPAKGSAGRPAAKAAPTTRAGDEVASRRAPGTVKSSRNRGASRGRKRRVRGAAPTPGSLPSVKAPKAKRPKKVKAPKPRPPQANGPKTKAPKVNAPKVKTKAPGQPSLPKPPPPGKPPKKQKS